MHKKITNWFILALGFLLFLGSATRADAAFRFISWADTKSGTAHLSALSNMIKALSAQPILTFYPGDLISSGSSLSSFQTWAAALNGGNSNGMLDKTFATRGNHDSAAATTWASFFDFSATAGRVGATNYNALTPDLTYSFDYQNAHFVGIDMPGGDVSSMAAGSISWLDSDLTAAEGRGLKHAFLFWHGPTYYVDSHSSSTPPALVTVLNKHPIISGSFHGHEHVFAHVTIDQNRIPGMTTNKHEEFVTGNAGAGGYSCAAGRSDYCQNYVGFATIDVLSDTQFHVAFYKEGVSTIQWEQTFTKGGPNSTPPPQPNVTPQPTFRATPRPSTSTYPAATVHATPATSPHATPSSNPNCTPSADADGNGTVNLTDLATWIVNYAKSLFGKVTGDFNCDGKTNSSDFAYWLKNTNIIHSSPGASGNPYPSNPVTPQPSGVASPQPSTPASPAASSSLGPNPTPPAGGSLWISGQETAQLPMSGLAWDNVKAAADGAIGTPQLSNQDSQHPQKTLAVALVYARTGQASYRTKAADAVMGIVGQDPGRSLALGRNLAPYVVAADLINFKSFDAGRDQQFRTWLSSIRTHVNSEGRSLVSCHEERPNNWGTMCGASRIAADIYLGDKTDLDRAAKVFKGYLGDRTSYAAFQFQSGAYTWMCDFQNPRPINPLGCTKDGHDLSGANVDDVQRGGNYTWPPNATNYSWGGFSAAVAQAELLFRAGYDAYSWESEAIKRGMQFLQSAMASSNSAPTDWIPWVVNHHYGTNFTAKTPVGAGRLMGWTDWTHAR